MPLLRIPAALAFTVVGGAAASCGDHKPAIDASTTCQVYCIPEGSGSSNCPPPTCTTGEHHDMCPAGCVPQPIA